MVPRSQLHFHEIKMHCVAMSRRPTHPQGLQHVCASSMFKLLFFHRKPD